MFIKSITLDGFKSYGNRVEVTSFDPAFNAITGLNGTGKSNILDSICFVLGITNLSNVRVGSLTELIYKHGQAGITKASVSITFDNRDKSQAPVGYESADEITVTREIVMGGHSKYLINGIIVQNKTVCDLFYSVQLNMDNPHFLIMQGHITKVLNMKPPEILSMIEEVAGTSMYETNKLLALNTIAKKDVQLAELDDIIKKDIAPKLQKIQDESAQYQKHQKVIIEINRITKLYKAYQYDLMEKKCAEMEQQVQTAEKDIEAEEALIKDNDKECKAIDKEIGSLKKLDEESSGVLQDIEETLSAAEGQELVAADTCAADSDTNLRRDQRAHQDGQVALQTMRARVDQNVSHGEVSETSLAMQRGSATQQEAAARATQLEDTVDDIERHREREFKKAKAALQEAREAADKHGAAWCGPAGELDTLHQVVAGLEVSVAAGRGALGAAADVHVGHQAPTSEEHSVQDINARNKAELALRKREVCVREARKDALRAAARDAELRCKELALALTALRRKANALRSAVAALAAEEPWIAAEKQFFGLAGGAYDFAECAADGAAARLEQLAAQRDALSHGFSARVHMLHAKEYEELLRIKGIVESDRHKLLEMIRLLDPKKHSTLLAATERVDLDFGTIFSSLLPGANARLVPQPGRVVLDGLDVRVALNGSWKESLDELSGGERWLVALSLVLAIMRFKPAPLYILDEVDTALDPSHTQNIAHMLRDHFRASQIIVVSQQDGMFNNANVLFRTCSQDGKSSVQRTVNARARARPRVLPLP